MPETNRPLKVFLSYASQDKLLVRELSRRLVGEGWIDTWQDEKNLLPGQDWRVKIEEAVEEADVVIIVLSQHSVSKEGHVQKELRYAREIALEKPEDAIFLIPLRLDECEVPRGLRFYQWVDYFDDKKDVSYKALVASLKLRYEQKLETEKKERLHREQQEREKAEKVVREKAEKEAAEKARLKAEEEERQRMAKEIAEREAAGKAARENAEKEATEKARLKAEEEQQRISKEQAEREAVEKATREKAEEEKRQRIAKGKVDREAAGKAAREKVETEKVKKGILEEVFFQSFTKLMNLFVAPKKHILRNVSIIGFGVVIIGSVLVAISNLLSLSTQTIEPIITPTFPEFSPSETNEMMVGVDGSTLVLIPAGEFFMGSNDQGYDNEQPVHRVNLDSFWINQTEVTNSMYAKCVASGVCKKPEEIRLSPGSSLASDADYYGNPMFDDYPVVYVNWDEANTYCSWAGGRLPTEAEWEKSARGTRSDDQLTYPWGDASLDCQRANYATFDVSCVGGPSSVGSYESGKSPYGIYDMAGNVWEWVSDWYSHSYYQDSPSANPLGPETGQYRIVRGGAWTFSGNDLHISRRVSSSPDTATDETGFRCVIPVENTSQDTEVDAIPQVSEIEQYSFPTSDDVFTMPITLISKENIENIKPLAHWFEGEISGVIDDVYSNVDASLVGVNTSNGVYFIHRDTEIVTQLLPNQPFQHRLKAISPNGDYFVTQDNESERMREQGYWQQSLYLWDSAQQAVVQKLDIGIDYTSEGSISEPSPILDVVAISFSSNGSEILALVHVSSFDFDQVRSFVWSMPDGELISSQVVNNNQSLIENLTYSNLGFGSRGTIEDRRKFGISLQSVYSLNSDQVALLKKEKTYDGLSYNMEILLLSFPSGDIISKNVLNVYSNAYLSIVGDSFVLVDLSVDGNLTEYSLDGEQISVLSFDHLSIGDFLAFTPNQDNFIAINGHKMMFVDTLNEEKLDSYQISQPVGGFAIHPTEDLMVISNAKTLDVYQISTRTLITSLSLKNVNNRYQPASITFSSDGKYLISQQYSDDRSLSVINTIWNTSNWSSVNEILTGNIRHVMPDIFQSQSLLLVKTEYSSQGERGPLSFFDINSNSINPETNLTDPIYSDENILDAVDIKISPDQKHLAYYGPYGSYPGAPQFALFDLSTMTSLSDLKSALASPILSYPVEWVGEGARAVIAFSPNSELLAVGPISGTYVIDLKSLKIKWEINDDSSKLLFSPDGNLLIGDGPIYDMKDLDAFMGFPLIRLPIAGDFIGMNRDGTLLITVSEDGIVTYWGITSE